MILLLTVAVSQLLLVSLCDGARSSPVTTTWRGGSLLAHEALSNPSASQLDYVTKAEYHELGSEALTRKWQGDEEEEAEADAEMEA